MQWVYGNMATCSKCEWEVAGCLCTCRIVNLSSMTYWEQLVIEGESFTGGGHLMQVLPSIHLYKVPLYRRYVQYTTLACGPL